MWSSSSFSFDGCILDVVVGCRQPHNVSSPSPHIELIPPCPTSPLTYKLPLTLCRVLRRAARTARLLTRSSENRPHIHRVRGIKQISAGPRNEMPIKKRPKNSCTSKGISKRRSGSWHIFAPLKRLLPVPVVHDPSVCMTLYGAKLRRSSRPNMHPGSPQASMMTGQHTKHLQVGRLPISYGLSKRVRSIISRICWKV